MLRSKVGWIAVAGGGVVATSAVIALAYWYRKSKESTPKRVIKSTLDEAVALKEKGNKYFKGGRFELAVKLYSEAIEKCSESNTPDDKTLAVFYNNRATAMHKMGRIESALSDVEKAIELDIKYSKALERRASLIFEMFSSNKLTSPDIGLRQALNDMSVVCSSTNFQSVIQMQLLNNIISSLSTTLADKRFGERSPESFVFNETMIDQHFSAFVRDPIKQMIDCLLNDDIGVESDISFWRIEVTPPSYVSALKCVENRTRYCDVIHLCELSLSEVETYPNSPWNMYVKLSILLLRAVFYHFSQANELSASDLEKIVDEIKSEKISEAFRDHHEKHSITELYVNALIRLYQLELEECISKGPESLFKCDIDGKYENCIKIDGNNVDIFYHRGQIMLLQDKLEAALKDFDRCLVLKPDYTAAVGRRLLTKYKMASASNSIFPSFMNDITSEFENTLKKDKTCMEVYTLYGQILTDLSRWEEAERVFERSLSVKPDHSESKIHLAMIALQFRGDLTKGISMLENVIKDDEKCELAYQTLATVEVQRGNVARATQLFDTAIDLCSSKVEMAHLIGMRESALATASNDKFQN